MGWKKSVIVRAATVLALLESGHAAFAMTLQECRENTDGTPASGRSASFAAECPAPHLACVDSAGKRLANGCIREEADEETNGLRAYRVREPAAVRADSEELGGPRKARALAE